VRIFQRVSSVFQQPLSNPMVKKIHLLIIFFKNIIFSYKAFASQRSILHLSKNTYTIQIYINSHMLNSTKPAKPFQSKEMHSYEIKKLIKEWMLGSWSINYGSIYPELQKLEKRM
jgi:hypothetical protein